MLTRVMWVFAAVLAAIALLVTVEGLLWQAGRRWYYEQPFPSCDCDACDWEADHAGA